MARNLDLTALRSFVAVAEAGGVTKAAGYLHLTQSAVSMQLKRLEEGLGLSLLDRSSRAVSLTTAGEQLLGYARRMLALNDEALTRLTDDGFEGEIVVGVPHDIVYPTIPQVLRQFHAAYPRIRVNLHSSYTVKLKDEFARGICDLILTTEDDLGPGGETLTEQELVWVGAPEGSAWRTRPLRLAFERRCIFRETAQKALDDAGIGWEMAIESEHTRSIEASLSADLAVHTMLDAAIPPHMEQVRHNGALPALGSKKINLYVAGQSTGPVLNDLAQIVRHAFSG